MSLRVGFLSTAALLCLAACASDVNVAGKFTVPANQPATDIPLIIEGDQILFEVEAEGPAGSRKLLVNLNMGSPYSGFQKHIYEEVGHVHGEPVKFRIGGIPVQAAPGMSGIIDDAEFPDRQLMFFFFTHKVEGNIQCGVLQNFDIALDYSRKTLTLAAPGTLPHDGVAVPIRVKPETGLASIDFMVDGKRYPMVIDVGGAYNWVRPSTAAEWLKDHPERLRGEGAVGNANYNMTSYSIEEKGLDLRIAKAALGPMEIDNVGALGMGGGGGPLNLIGSEWFIDQWQKDAAEPVVGWLSANVLKHYRVTIDYKDQMSWWKKIDDIDPHELDQVGLNLVYDKGVYSVGRIVEKDGKPTAKGVESGDKITAIDDAPVKGWSRDQLFGALRGKPGDSHQVTVERGGKTLTFFLPVEAF